MKIYILTSGSYSDYRIEGVFTDKSIAESMTKNFYDAEVEEFDSDPINLNTLEAFKEWNFFFVSFDDNGEIFQSYLNYPGFNDYHRNFRFCTHGAVKNGNKITVHDLSVWAKDQEHAIKIAAEKFAQFKLGFNY